MAEQQSVTVGTVGPFATVADIRAANRAIGHHWFDRDTVRFFGSRVGRTVYGGRFFVSSEQDQPFGRFPAAWNGERRWTVRMADDDGSITTVGPFGGYRSGEEARRAAQDLARELEGRA